MQQEGNFPIDKMCKVYDIGDFDIAIADLKVGKVRHTCCCVVVNKVSQ